MLAFQWRGESRSQEAPIIHLMQKLLNFKRTSRCPCGSLSGFRRSAMMTTSYSLVLGNQYNQVFSDQIKRNPTALRRFSQKGLDFGPAQVPAPAAWMFCKEPADPGHTVGDVFLLCPGFPQHGELSLRPARLEVQRGHAPTSCLRHIIPPQLG